MPNAGCDAIFASIRDWEYFYQDQFCDWTFIGAHISEPLPAPLPPSHHLKHHHLPSVSVTLHHADEYSVSHCTPAPFTPPEASPPTSTSITQTSTPSPNLWLMNCNR